MAPARASLLLAAALLRYPCWLQPQPLPPPPPSPEHRIMEIRSRLERDPARDTEQKELAAFARRYLDDALQALRAQQPRQAQRFADAADACRRPLDHLRHLEPGPGAPPHPRPPKGPPADQLSRVYFRLRLSEAFLSQIPAPAPARLLTIARSFYERAVKAQQESRTEAADEYAKAADDLTHALESLAQAAAP